SAPAPPRISTPSLHDALPIFAGGFAFMLAAVGPQPEYATTFLPAFILGGAGVGLTLGTLPAAATASLPPGRFATGSAVFGMARQDRKSTRLNSSHQIISYAVF